MARKRVLNVGQCMADHGGISWTIREHFEADVVPAHSAREALEKAEQEQFDLVLVNRVLDRDGTSGLDVIRQFRGTPALAKVPIMLVSNYEDAQQQAAALGAAPGFGKSTLRDEETVERLKPFLGEDSEAP